MKAKKYAQVPLGFCRQSIPYGRFFILFPLLQSAISFISALVVLFFAMPKHFQDAKTLFYKIIM